MPAAGAQRRLSGRGQPAGRASQAIRLGIVAEQGSATGTVPVTTRIDSRDERRRGHSATAAP